MAIVLGKATTANGHNRVRWGGGTGHLLAEVTVLAAAISHAMGWRWPMAVSRGEGCDEPSGFGMVVSRPIACDPDYRPNGCYGY